MSKGARLKRNRQDEEIELLRLREEELVRQLAAEQLNNRNASIFMGCLIKRLGAIVPAGIKMEYQVLGWRVIVTDEEFEALDGELEVKRSEGAMSTVLTVHKSERELEVDRERHRVHTDNA